MALVTDGRMSGASGKVPAAIHVRPEALAGGRWRRSCATATACAWMPMPARCRCWSTKPSGRAATMRCGPTKKQVHAHDLGRELFAGFRRNVTSAEEGAVSWL
ncbi:MAG: dihydroxy-acid dehydratase [Rubrivivax sp.]